MENDHSNFDTRNVLYLKSSVILCTCLLSNSPRPMCIVWGMCQRACLSAERGNVKSFETSRHPPAESLCSFTQCVHVYCHIRPGQCVYNTLFEVYVKSTCLPLSKSKVILNLSSPFLASLCSLTQNTSSRILPHPKALQNLETKIT